MRAIIPTKQAKPIKPTPSVACVRQQKPTNARTIAPMTKSTIQIIAN